MEENPLGLMTTKEAAQFLRVSTKTIESLRAQGELPIVRVGRRVFFKRDQLEDYVENQVAPQIKRNQ